MKYTTSVGCEIEVKPLPLTDKAGYIFIRKIIALSKEIEVSEVNTDTWWEKRAELHNLFSEFCKHMHVDPSHVGEPDIVPLLVYVQSGHFPDEKKV